MSEQLPPQLNYSQLNSLPGNTVNTSMVIAPSNGSGFLPGSVIYFDLPASGYMDWSNSQVSICLEVLYKQLYRRAIRLL